MQLEVARTRASSRESARPKRIGEFQTPPPAECVEHLLIVAGFPGAGKSKFIEQLLDDALPPDLMAALPAGCRHWTVVRPSCLADWLKTVSEVGRRGDGTGLVVHYDLMRNHGHALETYRADLTLRIVEFVKQPTIVTLRPTASRLRHQLAHRHFGGQTRLHLARGRVLFWIGRLGRPLLAPINIRRPRRLQMMIRRAHKNAKTYSKLYPWDCLNLYSRQGWLNQHYEQWDTFLNDIGADAIEAKMLDLEPATPVSTRKPMWRVVSTTKPSRPRQTHEACLT